jgi:prolyl oligopeptidase
MNPTLDLLNPRFPQFGVNFGWSNSPEDVNFMRETSPYQNLKRRSHWLAPLILATSTDGAFTVFARKYAARLEHWNMPYFYYEAAEGGHGFGTTVEELATHDAIVFTYLAQRLGRN